MDKISLMQAILSQSASSEEKALFQELMTEEQNRLVFQQLEKIWQQSEKVKKYRVYDSRQAFYQLDRKIKTKKLLRKRYLLTALSGVAAGIIILFGIFQFTGFEQLPFNTSEQIHFQTALGNRSVVHLPDGSRVWLNAKSDLQYNTTFNLADRTVSLIGEAYFEVEKSDKPFVVNVGNLKVKVYGTKFNVSAYADDPVIQTCLEEGKISIIKPGAKEFEMKPGELAAFEKLNSQLKVHAVNPDEYSGWRLNKLYLHNEPLQALAKKLERQYHITIGFTPANIGDKIHYSGVFGNESLEEILEAISTASELHLTKKGNHYQIVQ